MLLAVDHENLSSAKANDFFRESQIMDFHPPARRNGRGVGVTLRRILTVGACASALITALFGIGFIAAHCERLLNEVREAASVLDKENFFRDVANQLDRRDVDLSVDDFVIPEFVIDDDCTTSSPVILSTTPVQNIAIVTHSTSVPVAETSEISVPISTRTHTQTIFSVSVVPHTSAPTATPAIATEVPFCSNVVSTVTITYTVVPPWLSSSVLGDVTVTAGASTVTNVNTQVSVVTDIPVVTITARPSTLTNVQTDVSLTSDLPDATVSANPSTVTALQTLTSLVTLPNGQVSTTIVVTDLFTPPEPSLVTVTAVSTVKTTITTVHPAPVVITVSPRPVPSSADTTVTKVLTTTNSEPLTLTTTTWTTPAVVSHTFNAGNKTVTAGASRTASSSGAPTSPIVVVISAGARPELTIGGQLSSLMVFFAAIMFLL